MITKCNKFPNLIVLLWPCNDSVLNLRFTCLSGVFLIQSKYYPIQTCLSYQTNNFKTILQRNKTKSTMWTPSLFSGIFLWKIGVVDDLLHICKFVVADHFFTCYNLLLGILICFAKYSFLIKFSWALLIVAWQYSYKFLPLITSLQIILVDNILKGCCCSGQNPCLMSVRNIWV